VSPLNVDNLTKQMGKFQQSLGPTDPAEEAHLDIITKIQTNLHLPVGNWISFAERKAGRIVLLLIIAYVAFFSGDVVLVPQSGLTFVFSGSAMEFLW
jgi:hypothetical protein